MSKNVLLKSSGFMFRSDSNTEDLQNFAGAGRSFLYLIKLYLIKIGLFDSYPSEDTITELVTYS